MISKCGEKDFEDIYEIINDAAQAYKGVIPEDCWHEPYMTKDDLKKQMEDGVQFWGYWENDKLIGVMGIQDKSDVTLIRHAYVRSSHRNKGIGSKLLTHLSSITHKPVLIGTWAAAKWAIEFYKKHGFRLLPLETKDNLLRKYWSISERQRVESVVLTNKMERY